MKPKRRAGAAAVCASAVLAGTMASSSGSATAAPIPRRNVRRGREVFVMNIANLTCESLPGSRASRRDSRHL